MTVENFIAEVKAAEAKATTPKDCYFCKRDGGSCSAHLAEQTDSARAYVPALVRLVEVLMKFRKRDSRCDYCRVLEHECDCDLAEELKSAIAAALAGSEGEGS